MTILIQHLQRSFAERSKKNSRYSLRAFARSVGLDASTLSALLKGTRPLTPKMAIRILNQIEMEDPVLRATALNQVLGNVVKSEEFDHYTQLSNTQFEPISSWEHFAILSLLEIPDTTWSDKKIAQHLNISIGVAIEALSRLCTLGLIIRKKNHWMLLSKNLTTSNDVPNFLLRKVNREYIEKAIEALEDVPMDRRNISGITMAIDVKKLPIAKQMIQDFRRDLAKVLESGKKNQIFRLNVQFFPISKEWTKQ